MTRPTKTIEQFVTENPRYRNRDRDELARKIYEDVYSDMPYDEYLSIVMPQKPEQMEPQIITDLPPGTDLTSGTSILNPFKEIGVGGFNILRDMRAADIDYLKDKQLMGTRIDALNTLATVTLLDCISIRENQTLMNMLKDLEIKKTATDSYVLTKLEAADATVDFMANIIEKNIDSANLNRTEKAKERKVLNQVRSLKAEYAPLISAYRRALDKDEESRKPGEPDPLDTFFE